MKRDSAVVVDLGIRSEDHPNIIGISLHDMYARLCQLEELVDKTPRVTQYQVRQALKRMAALEAWVEQTMEVLSIHSTVLDTIVDHVLGDDRYALSTEPVTESDLLAPDPLPGL